MDILTIGLVILVLLIGSSLIKAENQREEDKKKLNPNNVTMKNLIKYCTQCQKLKRHDSMFEFSKIGMHPDSNKFITAYFIANEANRNWSFFTTYFHDHYRQNFDNSLYGNSDAIIQRVDTGKIQEDFGSMIHLERYDDYDNGDIKICLTVIPEDRNPWLYINEVKRIFGKDLFYGS